jgi:aldehyde dehydrogenase
MKSGKRAICAGPGNPPVLVDGTGGSRKAARDIIQGGAYDNNLLCIGEKQVFVLDHMAGAFHARTRKGRCRSAQPLAARKADRRRLHHVEGCRRLLAPVLNRALVGRDAAVLAREAGATVAAATPMLFAETELEHPFVMEEQMMPMLPIVRVKSVEEGIDYAFRPSTATSIPPSSTRSTSTT